MDNRELWYWLLNVENVTTTMITNLLNEHGSIEEIYRADKYGSITASQREMLELSKMRIDEYRRSYESLEKNKIRMILREDEDFPIRLRGIYDEPYGIFLRGRLPDDSGKSVAMVGARLATTHGKIIASRTAEELAKKGVQIVSGLAEGIDGSSHSGALDGGGYTLAVLGSGINVCFPRTHEKLYRRIMETGGIISEYGPGSPGLAYHFPARNRIISAMADILVLVEARERSGSLITVSCALEQGREVMAFPGRPDDASSEGCNRLIKEGAGICLTAQDIFEQLELLPPCEKRVYTPHPKFKSLPNRKPFLSEGKELAPSEVQLTVEEALVLQNLSLDPMHIDSIIASTGIGVQKIFALLSEMEIKGYIEQVLPGQYVKS